MGLEAHSFFFFFLLILPSQPTPHDASIVFHFAIPSICGVPVPCKRCDGLCVRWWCVSFLFQRGEISSLACVAATIDYTNNTSSLLSITSYSYYLDVLLILIPVVVVHLALLLRLQYERVFSSLLRRFCGLGEGFATSFAVPTTNTVRWFEQT